MRKNTKFKFPIELERGTQTIEYEVRCSVSPFDPGRTSGPPEKCYPPEGGEIEMKEVWYVSEKRCPEYYFSDLYRNGHPVTCKCKGKGKIRKAERREELDDLVDDKECMNHIPDNSLDY